jgi:hypothetical protein
MQLPAGTQVFAEHQPCQGFPLVLEGSIKVIKLAANGRELMLYRVMPGGSCIISAACWGIPTTTPAASPKPRSPCLPCRSAPSPP